MTNLSEVFDLEADEILSQIDEGVVDNMLERARWEEEPINLEDGGQMDLEDEGDMNEDDGDMEGAAEYWEDKGDAFEDVLEMDCDLVEGGDGMVTPMKTKCDGTTVPHPTVGMVFPSWEEVDKYYRSYGKQEGFGVVRIGGAKVRNKEEEMSKSLRGYYWRCESFGRTSYRRMVNGKRVFVSDEAIVKKKSKKCNCPVMIYAGRNKEGEWVLKKAENHHERHKPSPSKSKHIAMYRRDNMTKHLEARIHNDVESGARVSQIYNNIANQRNGVENCGFTKKDMHNVVNKKMRLQLKEGDAAAMLKYFDKMTSHNQVKEVPSQYFLDRWRKDIWRKHIVVKVAYYDPSKTEEVKRYERIMLAFEPVALRASVTDDLVEILLELIKLMVIQMDVKEGLSESEKKSGERGTVKGTIQSNVPSTPCSVNKEPTVNENGTPMTGGGSASVSTPLVAETFVKDPPARGKKAHRTTDKRFISVMEKKTTQKRKQRKKKKDDENTNPLPNAPHMQNMEHGFQSFTMIPNTQTLQGVSQMGVHVHPQLHPQVYQEWSQQQGQNNVATNLFPSLTATSGYMPIGGIHMTPDAVSYFTRNNYGGQPKVQHAGFTEELINCHRLSRPGEQ